MLMRIMKKLYVLVLCALLAFGAAACGQAADDKKPVENGAESNEPSEDVQAEDQSEQPEELPKTAPLAYGEIELPQLTDMEDGERIAVMTTNYGDITFRFFPEDAPKAVENFLTHAENGYYDGVIFHRVAPGFVIQGGDPLGTGMGGESIFGAPFENETTPKLHHIRGALAMANSGADTNGSQFYIVVNDGLSEEIEAYIQDLKSNISDVVGQDENGLYVTVGDMFPEAILDKYLEAGGAFELDAPFGNYTVFGQVIDGLDTVSAIAAVEFTEEEGRPGEGKPVNDVIIEKIEVTAYTNG